MSSIIRILMLGGARRVSIGELLIESGRKAGCSVELISYELSKEVPIASLAEVIVGLKWSDPNVVEDIIRISVEKEISMIIPFVDGAIEVAAKCKCKLPNVFVPVSEIDISEKMFDKVIAAQEFKKAQLPIPKTYSVLNAELPAIAKPRHGSASRGIKIFYNMAELMQLENLDDYLLQEYIVRREEYTVDCYVSQAGEILTTVPRKRQEVMGGESTRTETFHVRELEEMSRKVIDIFQLRGPVTLQYLHDLKKERFLLMEINPRLGGGVVCSIFAGAPITDYLISEYLDQPLVECSDWRPNTLMTRYLKEVIFYNE